MRRHAAILTALAIAGSSLAADEKPAFKVIVNPENPVRELDLRFVAEVFLKKTTRWPNNDLVRPIDLAGDAPARERFSLDVIGRSVSAVKSYWQQLIYSGRGVPPPEADSDASVVKYVLKHRAAIGYVSVTADHGTTKVVVVR